MGIGHSGQGKIILHRVAQKVVLLLCQMLQNPHQNGILDLLLPSENISQRRPVAFCQLQSFLYPVAAEIHSDRPRLFLYLPVFPGRQADFPLQPVFSSC